jgi:hypothetical protein
MPVALGEPSRPAPRVWVSWWAAIAELQQPESTRPYEGPPLLRLPREARLSATYVLIPQYRLLSAKTRYLRSVRL